MTDRRDFGKIALSSALAGAAYLASERSGSAAVQNPVMRN
jgi:hypothetical protein